MRRNTLIEAQPYPVEQALKKLGANLRKARLRRHLTIEDAAEKIGTGLRAVSDAERGKASTGIAVYAALLWAYDLLQPFEELANPLKDEQGLTLASRHDRVRARRGRGLDNDF
ncbi:MAG: helix-turn-helix transcriptional regulator [Terracidiphilus sp.]